MAGAWGSCATVFPALRNTTPLSLMDFWTTYKPRTQQPRLLERVVRKNESSCRNDISGVCASWHKSIWQPWEWSMKVSVFMACLVLPSNQDHTSQFWYYCQICAWLKGFDSRIHLGIVNLLLFLVSRFRLGSSSDASSAADFPTKGRVLNHQFLLNSDLLFKWERWQALHS